MVAVMLNSNIVDGTVASKLAKILTINRESVKHIFIRLKKLRCKLCLCFPWELTTIIILSHCLRFVALVVLPLLYLSFNWMIHLIVLQK